MRFFQGPRCYSDCDRKRILNNKDLISTLQKSLCQVANKNSRETNQMEATCHGLDKVPNNGDGEKYFDSK